ncbi:PREDICTED: uncharacterized protein LOC104603380 [Nelumbo nucifera]|uniref:Uncharacterized protein LOC104603380 n=2 Tax=Nelumbo nucifera TaxID=4432 RepID=A0A1U8ARQ7_NELNU|nr:PREDICTED: uncharacterized protein LOC104603380 [Nelumbo nucifera]DAD27330.1 TPA_asm: hypothetical protein HUJ06_028798 [Nelumbo nucifera]
MASASGAANGLLQTIFSGCIAECNTEIERRPYHRNCGCALHKSRRECSKGLSRSGTVSYPIRRAWSESCLALAAASNQSSPSPTSPANVPSRKEGTHSGFRKDSRVEWEA